MNSKGREGPCRQKPAFSTWNVGKEPELWLWIFAPNHSSEYLALLDSLNLAWGHCMHCWVALTTMLVMTERSDWEEWPTWFEPELCSVVEHLFSSWIDHNELKQIVGGKWEHLAEDPVQKIFNFHLWRKYSFIPREAGDMESEWNLFKASTAEKDCFKLWLEGCWCLLGQQPKNLMLRLSKRRRWRFGTG